MVIVIIAKANNTQGNITTGQDKPTQSAFEKLVEQGVRRTSPFIAIKQCASNASACCRRNLNCTRGYETKQANVNQNPKPNATARKQTGAKSSTGQARQSQCNLKIRRSERVATHSRHCKNNCAIGASACNRRNLNTNDGECPKKRRSNNT